MQLDKPIGYKDTAGSAMSECAGDLRNDARTCDLPGTSVVQLRSLSDHRAAVLAMRNKVGAKTVKGGLLSNVAELTEALEGYERPDWATHPMQTPQGLLAWQLERLKS